MAMRKILFFLALATVATVHATTIYSSFGPGDTFETGSGVVVTSTSRHIPSLLFTPGTDLVLSRVDFVTSIGSSSAANQVTVQIEADNNGTPDSNNPLISQSIVGQMGVGGDPLNGPALISWTPGITLNLTANVNYWISFTTDVLEGDVTWNSSSPGVAGLFTYNNNQWQASQNAVGAVRIIGMAAGELQSAPEPGTWLLLAAGLGSIPLFRKRRAIGLLAQ